MEVRKPESCQWSHWKWGTRLRQYGPDSVHSWLVAGACALASCFAMSVRRSSGLLFVAIQETFLTNKSDGSWPIMVMGAVMYLSAIGGGMVFIVAPTIINEHFDKRKGLAMGLNYTGVTMGLFVFPKLLEYLTKLYGLRGSLLIFGAVLMNGLAFSLFTRTPKWINTRTENQGIAENSSTSRNEKAERTLQYGLSVLKHPTFYLIMYSFNAYSLVFECYITLFVDFAIDRGVPVSSAVTISSMGAIAEIAGRFIIPAAVDRGLLGNKAVMVLLLSAEGIILILLPVISNHVQIFAADLVIAFLVGTGMVVFPMILASYFGQERLSMSFGMVIATSGMLSFAKPSLVGYFRDRVGAYDWLFVICGTLNLVGTAVWALVITLEARHKKNLKIQSADHTSKAADFMEIQNANKN
ncbi:monocarboxylate transporter 12-like isoform X2 [Amblyomma americanum]